MRRHHVHLSSDVQTARRVGARHGAPVVFAVDAAAMRRAGHVFYRSANGVWLTEQVPPAFLSSLEARPTRQRLPHGRHLVSRVVNRTR